MLNQTLKLFSDAGSDNSVPEQANQSKVAINSKPSTPTPPSRGV